MKATSYSLGYWIVLPYASWPSAIDNFLDFQFIVAFCLASFTIIQSEEESEGEGIRVGAM